MGENLKSQSKWLTHSISNSSSPLTAGIGLELVLEPTWRIMTCFKCLQTIFMMLILQGTQSLEMIKINLTILSPRSALVFIRSFDHLNPQTRKKMKKLLLIRQSSLIGREVRVRYQITEETLDSSIFKLPLQQAKWLLRKVRLQVQVVRIGIGYMESVCTVFGAFSHSWW